MDKKHILKKIIKKLINEQLKVIKENGDASIRGEYWIKNGFVEYADGDVGDYNHEAIVEIEIHSIILDAIGAEYDEFNTYEDTLESRIKEIISEGGDFIEYLKEESYEDIKDLHPDDFLEYYIKYNYSGEDLKKYLRMLNPGKDLRNFAAKEWNWISVHGNDIGCYQWDEYTRKELIRGVDDILNQERINFPDGEIILNISFYKGDSFEASLEDLKDGKNFMPHDKSFFNQKTFDTSKIDKSNLSSVYKGNLGDSVIPRKKLIK